MSDVAREIAVLTCRLDAQERQLTRYRRATIALVSLLPIGLLVAANAPGAKLVTAEKIALTDEDGKTLAALEMGPVGPRLAIYDKGERLRAAVGYNGPKDSAAIVLQDKKGTNQIIAAVADDDDGIVFVDRGKARLVLDCNEDGDAVIIMKDREGKPRTFLSGYAGDAGLTVAEEGGQNLVQLIGNAKGPKLTLSHKDGTTLFSAPTK